MATTRIGRVCIGRAGLTVWSWLPFTLWVMGQPVTS